MRLAFPKLKPVSPEALHLAALWATILDLAFAAAFLVVAVDAWAPPQDLPWKPLRLDQPVGMATRVKFARAARDAELCRQVLAEGRVSFVEVPDRDYGECATENTVRVRDGAAIPLSPRAPVMTCPVAIEVTRPIETKTWRRPGISTTSPMTRGGSSLR